ncbi:MAG: hypothetical protein QOK02_5371 [Mycobacterium sp.]|nr:hypothetical protein [Mycobacterium sp.]
MNIDLSSISSLLNLLVVVLIVAAIVAVVIWVVRLATAPRTSRAPAEERRPIAEERRVVAAHGHGVLAPGWYPDQNDPTSTRYFDGQMWTTATRPPR